MSPNIVAPVITIIITLPLIDNTNSSLVAMKRFILRGPRLFARPLSQLYGARIVPPLATNIDIDSAVLRSLNLSIHKWDGRPNSQYELLPPEVGKARLLGGPIVGIEEWRGTVEKVLDKTRCYPNAVFEVLWQTCAALVYSHPSLRRCYCFVNDLDLS